MPTDSTLSKQRWRRKAIARGLVACCGALAITALGTSCGGDGESGSPVGTLMVVSGNDQQAPANSPLGDPLRVRVVGKDGNVVPGVTVQFDTVEGRGAFAERFGVSNEKGIAEARYNVGKLPVRNRMTATITGATVEFQARALNGKPPVPTQRVDQLPLPDSIAFDNNGNALVSSELNGSIVQVHPSPVKFATELVFEYLYRGKTNSALTGLALDRAGNIFACDDRTGSVVRIDASAQPQIFVEGFQFDPFTTPSGIAVHPTSDEIYFTDTNRNRIFKVPPTGRPLTIWSEAIPQPNGLAFSASGDVLYVTSLGANAVQAVPVGRDAPAGEAETVASVPLPDGIALDVDGNIYVTGGASGKQKSGLWVIPADGSGVFLYFAAPGTKSYSSVAFGRAGFNLVSIYLISTTGTLDEVDVGVPGLLLPGPVTR